MTAHGTLKLILVTHSTSTDNEAGISSGWSDPDLSPTGEEQARAVGERYADEPLDLVVSSDLRRSLQTGDIAFGERDVELLL